MSSKQTKWLQSQQTKKKNLDEENFYFLDKINETIKEKIRIKGTQLKKLNYKIFRGVLTGLNDAFIINENTKKQIIKKDKNSAKIIKKVLRGRDIFSYKINDPKLWLIFTKQGIDISKFPAIEEHLTKFKSDLKPKKNTIVATVITYPFCVLQVDNIQKYNISVEFI